MLKRAIVLILLVAGFTLCSTNEASAWRRYRHRVVYRPVVVAPVRRVAYRAVLPPYPVARRVVVTRPYAWDYPVVYRPGVSVYMGY